MNKIEHSPFNLVDIYPEKREFGSKSSGKVIWITGLSGSGKTTLAIELGKKISAIGLKPILLDGDSMRKILFEKIILENDYSNESRKTFGMAYSRLSFFLAAQGFVVITSVIAMFEEIFTWNRINLPGYFEIYLKTPITVLQKRDCKGIYADFKRKKLKNVAGLDLKKDEPKTSDLIIEYKKGLSAEDKATSIMTLLHKNQYFI